MVSFIVQVKIHTMIRAVVRRLEFNFDTGEKFGSEKDVLRGCLIIVLKRDHCLDRLRREPNAKGGVGPCNEKNREDGPFWGTTANSTYYQTAF